MLTLLQKKATVDDVQVAELILVRPGERIPVDGIIRQGYSGLDESMLTGEAIIMPAVKPHALEALERYKMMIVMIKS
jgi:P-type E1-E2 ATPase